MSISAFLQKAKELYLFRPATLPHAKPLRTFAGNALKSAGVNASDRVRSSFNCRHVLF
ncbi:hypothetical protein AGR1B_Cc120058 [Agrobacterium fabacearum S56]|nr:hypothetical protein AGR1B_Cc120058 [Agrobacterium fabacearum S56]